jgi:hypothetical protein
MSPICTGLLILALIIGYVCVYALCKCAGDADRTTAELLRRK